MTAMKSFLIVFLLITAAAAEESSPTPPEYTYKAIRAWHAAGGLKGYHWPKMHKLDLNKDGQDEMFLGVLGFGRGMVYAVFTQRQGKWILLADDIEGSHHEFECMPASHDGWYDFRSLQPTGRGGLTETIYSWTGKRYSVKSSREIKGEELGVQ